MLQQYLLLVVVGISAGIIATLRTLRNRFGSTPDYRNLEINLFTQDGLEFVGRSALDGALAGAGSWFSIMLAFSIFHEEWKTEMEITDFAIVAATSALVSLPLLLLGLGCLARTCTLQKRLPAPTSEPKPDDPPAPATDAATTDGAPKQPTVSLKKRNAGDTASPPDRSSKPRRARKTGVTTRTRKQG